MSKPAIEILKAMTGHDSRMSVERIYCEAMGRDLAGGMFLSELLFWSDKGSREDGFFYRTAAEWEERCYLSRYQVDKYTTICEEAGFLETTVIKANGAPTKHYRIRFENFINWICENLQIDLRKFTNPGFANFRKTLTDPTQIRSTEGDAREARTEEAEPPKAPLSKAPPSKAHSEEPHSEEPHSEEPNSVVEPDLTPSEPEPAQRSASPFRGAGRSPYPGLEEAQEAAKRRFERKQEGQNTFRLAAPMAELNMQLPIGVRKPLAETLASLLGKTALIEVDDRALLAAHEAAIKAHGMGYTTPDDLERVAGAWDKDWRSRGGNARQLLEFLSEQAQSVSRETDEDEDWPSYGLSNAAIDEIAQLSRASWGGVSHD